MTELREVAGLPVTPYNGTGGWSGSEASKERAYYLIQSGELSRYQTLILQHLLTAKAYGATWAEISIPTKNGHKAHHGSISGPLSNLHKAGHISRLAEKRNRSHIYVINEWVMGRETSPYKPNKRTRVERVREPLSAQERLEKRDAIISLLISRRFDQPTPAHEYMQVADQIVSLFDIQGD